MGGAMSLWPGSTPGGSEARAAQTILRITIGNDRVTPLSFPGDPGAGIGVPPLGGPQLQDSLPRHAHPGSPPQPPFLKAPACRSHTPPDYNIGCPVKCELHINTKSLVTISKSLFNVFLQFKLNRESRIFP